MRQTQILAIGATVAFMAVAPALAQWAPASLNAPRASEPTAALVGTWQIIMVGESAGPGSALTVGTDGVPAYWVFDGRRAQMMTIIDGRPSFGGSCPYTLGAVDRAARSAVLTLRCPGGEAARTEPTTLRFTRDYRAAELVTPAPSAPRAEGVNALTTVLSFVGGVAR